MIKKDIETNQELLNFTVLPTAKTYDNVNKACVEFGDDPDVFGDESSSMLKPNKSSNDCIEDISNQLADMKLLLTRKSKTTPNHAPAREPYCWRCKRTGHHTSQSKVFSRQLMKCSYCEKHNHMKDSCYTKQADEDNKASVEANKVWTDRWRRCWQDIIRKGSKVFLERWR